MTLSENLDKQLVAKELKNLILDVKFKDTEPMSDSRNRGRKTDYSVVMKLNILA